MKVNQTPEFQPITIVLETKDEVEAVWFALRCVSAGRLEGVAGAEVIRKLSDWFSNEAQL